MSYVEKYQNLGERSGSQDQLNQKVTRILAVVSAVVGLMILICP